MSGLGWVVRSGQKLSTLIIDECMNLVYGQSIYARSNCLLKGFLEIVTIQWCCMTASYASNRHDWLYRGRTLCPSFILCTCGKPIYLLIESDCQLIWWLSMIIHILLKTKDQWDFLGMNGCCWDDTTEFLGIWGVDLNPLCIWVFLLVLQLESWWFIIYSHCDKVILYFIWPFGMHALCYLLHFMVFIFNYFFLVALHIVLCICLAGGFATWTLQYPKNKEIKDAVPDTLNITSEKKKSSSLFLQLVPLL